MNLYEFNSILVNIESEDELIDFSRKYVLHGTPHVFLGQDDKFYEFRKRIANNFQIPFHEVYITGSAKLGFSPFKSKDFDYDSDIDVAIISANLFEKYMKFISEYQISFFRNKAIIRESELFMYHEFLEYTAIGWIRPDKLPVSFQMGRIKDDWFTFFQGISYGKSEVGNFKVAAGIFKNYEYLEQYITGGLRQVKSNLIIKERKWQNR